MAQAHHGSAATEPGGDLAAAERLVARLAAAGIDRMDKPAFIAALWERKLARDGRASLLAGAAAFQLP